MQRLVYFETNDTTTVQNWTAPAGITSVFVQILDGSTHRSQMYPLVVIPNTTYTITRVATGFAANNPNTFGSIWSWTGGRRLRIYWLE